VDASDRKRASSTRSSGTNEPSGRTLPRKEGAARRPVSCHEAVPPRARLVSRGEFAVDAIDLSRQGLALARRFRCRRASRRTTVTPSSICGFAADQGPAPPDAARARPSAGRRSSGGSAPARRRPPTCPSRQPGSSCSRRRGREIPRLVRRSRSLRRGGRPTRIGRRTRSAYISPKPLGFAGLGASCGASRATPLLARSRWHRHDPCRALGQCFFAVTRLLPSCHRSMPSLRSSTTAERRQRIVSGENGSVEGKFCLRSGFPSRRTW
jgi:hypothetical protein